MTLGKLKPHYFGGGILGAIFVTSNIILMPHLGATVTTIVGMFGQMLMALLIDHFGLLGVNKNQIHTKKVIGLVCITMGIILLRSF
ncbi:DMT family transporter [Priestia megaterium]|nr:DMT family transporter [Priestia megaterium]